MDCPCPKPANNRWSLVARTARAVLGVPDYEAYLAHMAERHPGGVALTRDAVLLGGQPADPKPHPPCGAIFAWAARNRFARYVADGSADR